MGAAKAVPALAVDTVTTQGPAIRLEAERTTRPPGHRHASPAPQQAGLGAYAVDRRRQAAALDLLRGLTVLQLTSWAKLQS